MKSHALFQQYIWLVNTIYRAGKISLEEINRKWLDTDLSEGLPLARSTFNRHKDAIEDMFGSILSVINGTASSIISAMQRSWRKTLSKIGCFLPCR